MRGAAEESSRRYAAQVARRLWAQGGARGSAGVSAGRRGHGRRGGRSGVGRREDGLRGSGISCRRRGRGCRLVSGSGVVVVEAMATLLDLWMAIDRWSQDGGDSQPASLAIQQLRASQDGRHASNSPTPTFSLFTLHSSLSRLLDPAIDRGRPPHLRQTCVPPPPPRRSPSSSPRT